MPREKVVVNTWEDFLKRLPPELKRKIGEANGDTPRIVRFFEIRVGLRNNVPNSQMALRDWEKEIGEDENFYERWGQILRAISEATEPPSVQEFMTRRFRGRR